MKKIFVLLFVLSAGYMVHAQKIAVSLNHIAVYVTNLQKSTAFYKDIIGLDTIPEPFHDGKHTWFKVAEHSHLHVISGAKEATPHVKDSHLCFSVNAMDAFIKRLDDAGIPFEDWAGTQHGVTKRVDGIRQIYFKDPDGYWIEVNSDYPAKL